MKSLSKLIIFCCVLFILSPAMAAVPTVSGRFLYDACGNKIIIRGVEQILGAGLCDDGACVAGAAQTGANAIRFVIDTGSGITVAQVQNAIDIAISNHMLVYLDPYAQSWFTQSSVKTMIAARETYIIMCAHGEGTEGSDSAWITACESAITTLRNYGYTSPLTCISRDSGRNPHTVMDNGQTIVNYDPLHNVILGCQVYWTQYYRDTYGMTESQAMTQFAAKGFMIQAGICSGHFEHDAGCWDYPSALSGAQSNQISWLWWDWYNPYDDPSYKDSLSLTGNYGDWATYATDCYHTNYAQWVVTSANGLATGVKSSCTGGGTAPGQASSPSPANAATGVSTTATLSWTAGSGATSHDVYFGTATTPPLIGNQTATTYKPATMANSTTYRWRINEKNASGTTTGAVWSFTTAAAAPPGQASSPNPANSATGVSTSPTLSWTAGSGATSHDVYFGTATTPPLIQNQTATTYSPGTLATSTTYRWKIDEKNASGTTTGAVWSFTTGTGSGLISVGKPATASSSQDDQYCTACTAAKAVDGSTSTRWSSAQGVDPQWIYVDLGQTATINRVVLRWESAYASAYNIQVSANTTDWTSIYSTTTGDGGVDDLSISGSGRYVRMYGTVRGTTYGYSLWEFEIYGTFGGAPPGQASNPSPANGATSVGVTTDLSWTAGSGATSHDVYFGTATTPPLIGNQTATTYDTGTMANSTTYRWRINEKNANGTTTGAVWSFTTAAAGGDYGAELLTNPSFESGTTGWTKSGSGSGSLSAVTSDHDITSAQSGSYFVIHTTATATDSGCYQEVSLSTWASQIAAGKAQLKCQGWLQAAEHAYDNTRLRVIFYNASGGTVATYDSGTITHGPAAWTLYGVNDYTVPATSTKVRIWATFVETGWDAGAFDNATCKIKILP